PPNTRDRDDRHASLLHRLAEHSPNARLGADQFGQALDQPVGRRRIGCLACVPHRLVLVDHQIPPSMSGCWNSRAVELRIGWLSYIRSRATTPDAAVSPATTQIAAGIPKRSAMTPASTAPIAKPRSRHRR